MTAGEHTHRDTFAFVLTILGATLWATLPAATFIRGHGTSLGLPLVFGAGALLGAWAGAAVWREVSWATPAVAGAMVAAVVTGTRGLAISGSVDVGSFELTCVASALIGGAAGALLGRRSRRPRPALVAAWIAIGAPAIAAIVLSLASSRGYDIGRGTVLWSILLAFVPGAVTAALLCRDAQADAFAAWLFGLLYVAFLLVVIGQDDEKDTVQKGIALSVFCFFIAGISAVPVRWMQRRRRERPDLPSATVVDR